MTDDDLAAMERLVDTGAVSTHFDGCQLSHPRCAVAALVTEVRRLRLSVPPAGPVEPLKGTLPGWAAEVEYTPEGGTLTVSRPDGSGGTMLLEMLPEFLLKEESTVADLAAEIRRLRECVRAERERCAAVADRIGAEHEEERYGNARPPYADLEYLTRCEAAHKAAEQIAAAIRKGE